MHVYTPSLFSLDFLRPLLCWAHMPASDTGIHRISVSYTHIHSYTGVFAALTYLLPTPVSIRISLSDFLIGPFSIAATRR